MPTQMCNELAQRCVSDCTRDPDADHDGHRDIACGGDDCNDADPNEYPGHQEVCDPANPTHDEDCDFTTYANPRTHDGDMDGDGYVSSMCCNQDRNGNQICGPDCDDTNRNIHPNQSETCNGVDDNCNGMIDEGLGSQPICRDLDGDGHGAPASGMMMGCVPPTGWSFLCDDCNDHDAMIHPGAMEVCNGHDDDCNPATVEHLLRLCHDGDHDGHGVPTMTMMLCAPTADWILNCDGDCNDANPAVYPGNTEVCNGIDDNCVGGVDEGLPTITCFPDADGDGYRAMGGATTTCHPACPAGMLPASFPTDCCDSDANVRPNQTSYFATADACGDFDYDCSSGIELSPGCLVSSLATGGGCVSRFTTPATCNGCLWSMVDFTPACGSIATYQSCSWNGTRCGGTLIVNQLVSCH
jgi:hypothetical protein